MNAQDAYFWGDFNTDNTLEVGIASGATVTTPTLMGLDTGDDIRSVALSSDGTMLAVSGRNTAADTYVINIYAADGSGNPTTVAEASTLTNTAAIFTRMSFSPDGSMLVFTADGPAGGAYRAYVVPTDGTNTTPKLISQDPASTTQDVQYTTWIDNTHVVFSGDTGTTNNYDCMWSVDVTAATPVQTELCPYSTFTTSGQDVNTDFPPMVDAMGRVYYVGDWELGNNEFRLYRADMDGQNQEQVPGSAVMVGGNEIFVGSFGVSPNGGHVAFAAETEANMFNVFTLDLTTTTPTQITSFTTANGGDRGPDDATPIFWSADETMLAVRADWEVNSGDPEGDHGAFVIDIANTTATRVLQSVAGGDAFDLGFTADSSRLYVRGDLAVDGETEVFSTTDFATADQALAGATVQGVPADTQTIYGLLVH